MALLQGCIMVPIPKGANDPRFTDQQIADVGTVLITRDAVKARWGFPDVSRGDDRLWAYKWTIERGRWFAIPLAPIFAGDAGPINAQDHVMFVEFDERGLVTSREVASASEASGQRVCSPRGICLEHKSYIGENRDGLLLFDFRDPGSAIVLKPDASFRPGQPAPSATTCVVTLWPRPADWGRHETLLKLGQPFGVGIGIGPADDRELRTEWLPVGAYGEWLVSAGEAVVLQDPRFHDMQSAGNVRVVATDLPLSPDDAHSSASFQCQPGIRLYFEIAARPYRVSGLTPIELIPVEADAALAVVSSLRRLVPRNTQPQ